MKIKRLMCILLCTVFVVCGCSTGEENANKKVDLNYFNGPDKLHSYSKYNRRHIMYDDKYTYICMGMYGYFYLDDENGYSVCTDASCKHMDSKCIACGDNIYFMFNDTLYCGENQIVKCDTQEVVFQNEIPKEYSEEKSGYENHITDIYTTDQYIILIEGGYGMVLDGNFREVIHFKDTSGTMWYSIEDDYLHFLNQFNKIEKISLIDKSIETVDVGIEYVLRAYDNEKYFFAVDRYSDLYRIDKKTKEKVYLASGVSDVFVLDDYLYYMFNNGKDGNTQRIIDIDGKLIKEINSLEELGVTMDIGFASYLDEKICVNGTDTDGRLIVVEMSLDGSRIKKYEIRD